MTRSYRAALPYRAALAPVLALAALGLAAPAHAQTTQFSDRASFNAATTGLTTFTFDGYAPKNRFTNYPTGLTVDGVGFADGSGASLLVADPGQGFGDPFGGHQYLDTDGLGTISVTLPAGTTAFGADFANFFAGSGALLTATVNGTAFTFQAPGSETNASAFAGFTSSVPITSLIFSGGEGVVLDNVSFGKAVPSAVPEPSQALTFAVAGVGLGGLVIAARRKKASAAL